MAVNLAPVGNDAPYVDSSGDPFTGALLYTYTAGSTTPEPTYTTSLGNVQNDNPMTLNSSGYPTTSNNQTQVWLTAGVSYKFILKNSGGTTIWTRDNLVGINDTTVTIDQWVAGPTPTFINATSFSLVGDQTSTFHVGRRIKTTNSGGTIYSTIATSAFAVATTITVVNDSGVLDSGLSAVSYGLLSADNPSTPLLTDAYPVISGSSDKTKKLRFEVDGFTTATTRVMTPPNQDSGIGLQLETEQATTSGTSIDFTGIPAWVKRITVMLAGVSTNGTSALLVQLGDSGGIENSGYLSAASRSAGGGTSTAGFILQDVAVAADAVNGHIVLTLENSSSFTWVQSGTVTSPASLVSVSAGRKATSAALDRVRLTTVNGTDAFDAGAVNILLE